MTCYLCAPDEYPTDDDALDAWNEACAECDANYWKHPVAIYLHDDAAGDDRPTR